MFFLYIMCSRVWDGTSNYLSHKLQTPQLCQRVIRKPIMICTRIEILRDNLYHAYTGTHSVTHVEKKAVMMFKSFHQQTRV